MTPPSVTAAMQPAAIRRSVARPATVRRLKVFRSVMTDVPSLVSNHGRDIGFATHSPSIRRPFCDRGILRVIPARGIVSTNTLGIDSSRRDLARWQDIVDALPRTHRGREGDPQRCSDGTPRKIRAADAQEVINVESI